VRLPLAVLGCTGVVLGIWESFWAILLLLICFGVVQYFLGAISGHLEAVSGYCGVVMGCFFGLFWAVSGHILV
jgi:hypothetical protein